MYLNIYLQKGQVWQCDIRLPAGGWPIKNLMSTLEYRSVLSLFHVSLMAILLFLLVLEQAAVVIPMKSVTSLFVM